MEKFETKEDPVIQEIRTIREEISNITAEFSDEELLAWYISEAQEALQLASSKRSEPKSP